MQCVAVCCSVLQRLVTLFTSNIPPPVTGTGSPLSLAFCTPATCTILTLGHLPIIGGWPRVLTLWYQNPKMHIEKSLLLRAPNAMNEPVVDYSTTLYPRRILLRMANPQFVCVRCFVYPHQSSYMPAHQLWLIAMQGQCGLAPLRRGVQRRGDLGENFVGGA